MDQDVEVGFYIAGKDRQFHHARARVRKQDSSLEVWGEDVPEPVAVRYGWSNLPAGGPVGRKDLLRRPLRS